MTPDQNERLTLLLQELEPCLKDMKPNSRTFVEDQIKRHAQYGERMFISVKQSAWLDNLYEEHVGPLDGLGGGQASAVNDKNDDIDDGVPF